MQMTAEQLKALEDGKIIEVRGFSGCAATVEQAVAAPELVQIHSMAGKVYDLARATVGFMLIEVDADEYAARMVSPCGMTAPC